MNYKMKTQGLDNLLHFSNYEKYVCMLFYIMNERGLSIYRRFDVP